MSQQMVTAVVHSLLSDEDLRVRFVMDPLETIANLNLRGVDLTPEEIDVLLRADARLWFWSEELFGAQMH
jgi:hypothetical protein